MKLQKIDIAPSLKSKDHIRLSGQVTYADRPGQSETIWYDFPKDYSEAVGNTGNLWLTLLLPLAMQIGEPLQIPLLVDSAHVENAEKLMGIWMTWYPNLKEIKLELNATDEPQGEAPQKSVSFFSGGVDSFFTLMDHCTEYGAKQNENVDELILVWGFDIAIGNDDFFNLLDRCRKAADHFNRPLIDVYTNIRETRLKEVHWGYLLHGSALASVALALEGRYGKVYIASSTGHKNLQHWGSHQQTDPLFSTGQTEFIHDGLEANRVEKTVQVMKSPVAMETLHVCYKHKNHTNCSKCVKCLRSLAIFDILGALGQCKTFDIRLYRAENIKKVYIPFEYEYNDWLMIQNEAMMHGRQDIAGHINSAVCNTQRYKKWFSFFRKLRKRRFMYRLAEACLRGLESRVVL